MRCTGTSTIKSSMIRYSPINPRPMDGSAPGGRWEIVEDDAENTLSRVINTSVRTN